MISVRELIWELIKRTHGWELYWEAFKGKFGNYFEKHLNGLQFGKYLKGLHFEN